MKLKAYVEAVNDKCLSNDYLTECMESYMGRAEHELVGSRDEADVIVLTGCNVIEHNPDIFRDLLEYARRHPEKTVLASGCVPKIEEVRSVPNFHLLPYSQIVRNPEAVRRIVPSEEPFKLVAADKILPDRVPWWTVAGVDTSGLCYLRISEGCLSNCSYCAIRNAKGTVFSTPLDVVMEEFEDGLSRGRTKFWFITDDTGAWGKDLGLDVSDLLARMKYKAPSARLFLYGFNPCHMLELYPKLEGLLDMACFLLLPIQSGSNRVLKLMRREYDIDRVLPLVDEIKRKHPSVYVATEIIVGFPTETREEFAQSLKAASHFDAAYFSPMTVFTNTAAHHMEGKTAKAEIDRRREMAAELGRRMRTHRVCDPSVYFPKDPTEKRKDDATAVIWVRR